MRAVVLIRHAQSQHHVLKLSGGWTDTPLTPLGDEQARRVAARLREELHGVPVTLYTRDLIRAAQTCAHIAEALGCEAVVDARLRELNNGDAAGMTFEESMDRFPQCYARSLFDPEGVPFPNGESGAEFLARCGRFLDSLPAEGPTPVLVTHGGTILGMVAHWLRIPQGTLAGTNFNAGTTSVTVLTDGRFRTVERLNDASHLSGLEGYEPLAGALNPAD